MKKLLIIGPVLVVLGLVIAALTTPIFAQSPREQSDGEAMHQACQDGDWEAMAEAAQEYHGEDFSQMPCSGDVAPDGNQNLNRGSNGGGMMDGGWSGTGGMMSW